MIRKHWATLSPSALFICPQCEGGLYHLVSQRRLCYSAKESPEGVGGGDDRLDRCRRSFTTVCTEWVGSLLPGTLWRVDSPQPQSLLAGTVTVLPGSMCWGGVCIRPSAWQLFLIPFLPLVRRSMKAHIRGGGEMKIFFIYLAFREESQLL